jgi:protease-4
MEENVVEDNDAGAKVAVIDVAGEIKLDRDSQLVAFGSAADNIVGRTREQLDLAAEDDDVRAVVVRISSPGGQVYPSMQIHRELARFREQTGKPVVAYVPDLAASGGYLVAVGADEIVADDAAITGSIGVLLMIPELSGLMELVHVKVNVFKTGERKDVGNPFREMTDEDRAEIMKLANYYHAKFKEIVNAGRPKLEAEQIDALADGRVFTAGEALELGLVDAVGDLASAHDRAAQRIGLTGETTDLVIYRRRYAYGNNVYAMRPSQIGGVQLNFGADALVPRPEFLFLWRPGL